MVASAREFSPTALYKLEEGLLPALNRFISQKEEHLKEIEEALSRTSVLKTLSGDEVGEYLGNPLNQFHVVKRFVDDWGRLEEYLNSDSSIDRKFQQSFVILFALCSFHPSRFWVLFVPHLTNTIFSGDNNLRAMKGRNLSILLVKEQTSGVFSRYKTRALSAGVRSGSGSQFYAGYKMSF